MRYLPTTILVIVLYCLCNPNCCQAWKLQHALTSLFDSLSVRWNSTTILLYLERKLYTLINGLWTIDTVFTHLWTKETPPPPQKESKRGQSYVRHCCLCRVTIALLYAVPPRKLVILCQYQPAEISLFLVAGYPVGGPISPAAVLPSPHAIHKYQTWQV